MFWTHTRLGFEFVDQRRCLKKFSFFLFLNQNFQKFKGKMDKIMDEIPCSEVEADESRFIKIIKEAIKTKEVKSYKAFTNGKKHFVFFF